MTLNHYIEFQVLWSWRYAFHSVSFQRWSGPMLRVFLMVPPLEGVALLIGRWALHFWLSVHILNSCIFSLLIRFLLLPKDGVAYLIYLIMVFDVTLSISWRALSTEQGNVVVWTVNMLSLDRRTMLLMLHSDIDDRGQIAWFGLQFFCFLFVRLTDITETS